MKIQAILAGAFVLLAATAAQADPHIGQTAFSLMDSNTSQDVFKPDTPKVVLHAELVELPDGTKVAADWIAEKTDVVPANYKVDSAEIVATSAINEATFSMTKPNAGWPVGDYRVDLSIDGKSAISVKFKIAE
ncbi:MAG: hypothetical protein JWN11_1276 [Hyphomicrobiales bacterium]|nr:hypothetical protein [Hyphomicrobiales bacterium]